MNIVINPAYSHLKTLIHNIPSSFSNENELIYKGRNTLKLLDTGTSKIVVKSFKIPHIINKIVYSYVRASKAKRSYEHAFEIIRRGFNTPAPIAYIEEFKSGLLSNSYYISEYCDYGRSFKEFSNYQQIEGKEDIIIAFADFVCQLQKAGIYHKDMSNGNVLFRKEKNSIEFSLVDINRMRFGRVGKTQGYKNFQRLWVRHEMLILIAERYALDCGFDAKESIDKILYYNQKIVGPPRVFPNSST